MRNSIFNAISSANPDGIAIEALTQAERQFLEDDYNLDEGDDGIREMVYKDDYGYYRITGSNYKWTLEEFEKQFGKL